MQDLVVAARETSLPFTASADGTYVCFERTSECVCVVRNAWRGGCTVWEMSDEGRQQVGHFLDAKEAVSVAVDLVLQPESSAPSVVKRVHPRKLAS